jgi:hypothetical protein
LFSNTKGIHDPALLHQKLIHHNISPETHHYHPNTGADATKNVSRRLFFYHSRSQKSEQHLFLTYTHGLLLGGQSRANQ